MGYRFATLGENLIAKFPRGLGKAAEATSTYLPRIFLIDVCTRSYHDNTERVRDLPGYNSTLYSPAYRSPQLKVTPAVGSSQVVV